MYTIFGGVTTVANISFYYLCYNIFNIPNVSSTILAWVIAVGFAFITNKIWVFDSKKFDKGTLVHEIPTFLGARIITGIIDVVIMYVSVDVMGWSSVLCKFVSNMIVIILNYVANKFLIFKNNNRVDGYQNQ